MSDTIRERIISAIVSRLAAITIANGYNTDMGNSVFRVQHKLDPGDLPACVVWPRTEEADRNYGKQICVMPVRIEGLAVCISYTPLDNFSVVSEKILGDMIRCICGGTLAQVTGGLADDVKYTGGGTDEYPDAGETTVGASAVFDIGYKYLSGDPYSQS